MDNNRKKIIDEVKKYWSLKGDNKIIPGINHIPSAGKVIEVEEIINLVHASLDGWLTTGRFNSDFESKLADFLTVKHAITVNSGSSANLVAFTALTSPKLGDRAIKKGDEVIAVAAGFPTTVNPIIQNGAVPVFLDVEIETLNIDVSKIEEAITSKTKAIMIAHTLGNPFNLEQIRKVCDNHNLWLVEDCCDALGATYNGQKVGTFGDIATLSFYPAHHLTMGEGGAVFTNNANLKTIAESFRDWGRDCYCPPGCDNTCGCRFSQKLGSLPFGYDHKFTYSHLGYNLKITDMQAACGLSQLEKVDRFINKRKENHKYLSGLMSNLSKYFMIQQPTKNSDPSWFGFGITLKQDVDFKREELLEFLNSKNIGTRLLFAGNIIKQPYFKDVEYRVVGELKNTDIIMNNTFWIGIFPALGKAHADYVYEAFEEFLGLNF